MKTEQGDRYGAFLLYVDDWLSSSAIELMTAPEERGYLRLLMHAWKAEDCGLPDDDEALAQLSKLGRAWSRNGKSGAVLRAQFVAKDGRLYNERLSREREYQQGVRAKRCNAGKAGNDARWYRKRIANGSQNDPNPNPIYKTDLEYAPTNHKNRDSSPRDGGESHYPQLRQALMECMREPDQEDIYPRERTVVDVMHAAGGATEGDVIAALRYLREDRNLKPGTPDGPRHFAWFKTVIQRHFTEKRERDLPPSAQLPDVDLDAGTEVF